MYPFSELLTGDYFIFDEDDKAIKVKVGTSCYRNTGDVYVGNGKMPEYKGRVGEEFAVEPSRSVRKLMNLMDIVHQIQHDIWEMSVHRNESYSDTLDRIIKETSKRDDEEAALVHKVAVMIRDARDSGHDGICVIPEE